MLSNIYISCAVMGPGRRTTRSSQAQSLPMPNTQPGVVLLHGKIVFFHATFDLSPISLYKFHQLCTLATLVHSHSVFVYSCCELNNLCIDMALDGRSISSNTVPSSVPNSSAQLAVASTPGKSNSLMTLLMDW